MDTPVSESKAAQNKRRYRPTKTIEYFKKQMAERRPDVEILGTEYIDSKTAILCKDKKCHCTEPWYPTPNNLMNGASCKHCKSERTERIPPRSHEDHVALMKAVNPHLEMLSSYSGCFDLGTYNDTRCECPAFEMTNHKVVDSRRVVNCAHCKPARKTTWKPCGSAKESLKDKDNLLARLAVERNLTFLQIADGTGISVSTVSRHLRGLQHPPMEMIARYATFFGLPNHIVYESVGNQAFDLKGRRFYRWTVLHYSHCDRFRKRQWLCICDCGNERVVSAGNLLKGGSQSCGCVRAENQRRVPKHKKEFGQSFMQTFWYQYQKTAMRRGMLFDLSLEQFESIVKQDCTYCGEAPKPRPSVKRGLYGYPDVNGVDRKDNSQGYTFENCVPCCGDCNTMKGTLSEGTFIAKCHRIAARCKIKSIK